MVTGLIENLAGFGLPIAIGAPMLVALGVPPLTSIAATAIGHTWAVSMSGMALAFRTLADVTKINQAALFPTTALLLGIAVLLTGIAAAFILGQQKHWWRVIILGVIAAGVQYLSGIIGMIPVSSFIASIIGIVVGMLLSKKPEGWRLKTNSSPELKTGVLTYGFLIFAIMVVTVIKPINKVLSGVTWTMQFPQAVSTTGFTTPAGSGYLFHPLVHPGLLILLTSLFAILVLPRFKSLTIGKVGPALKSTIKGAVPAGLGTLFMIALSSLMEHTGMTLQIAGGLSRFMGMVYPAFSPLVGMVGSFATGSNTNSKVLFGPLQKGVADLLKVSPIILLAAQTVGGSLGSMIAPAKLAVGGSTSAEKGLEGQVLRITLPIGLVIALIVGVIAWVFVMTS
jgi:lactate permease